jgi:hypothetical protein
LRGAEFIRLSQKFFLQKEASRSDGPRSDGNTPIWGVPLRPTNPRTTQNERHLDARSSWPLWHRSGEMLRSGRLKIGSTQL